MILTHLEIDGLRSLRSVCIDPHPHLNLLSGPNGAGKSSVLEAIHCLSTGHSFRSRKPRELVTHDREELVVTARLREDDGEREHRIGFARQRDGTLDLRVDFERVDGVSAATRLLPVKALSPDSHALIQEGPDERRRFLDWGVFHVEPRFLAVWRRFRRALSQRNQALREQMSDAEVVSWDEQLAEAGTELDRLRRAYVESLEAVLGRRLERLNTGFGVKLRYRGGWSDGLSLESALTSNREHHRRMRTTTDGPHRGELVITTGGVPVRQELSRGQQKMLVYLLHLAQLDLLSERDGGQAVVLCDDLLSELDSSNAGDLIEQLMLAPGQLFVTGVTLEPLASQAHTSFHVERGTIKASA